MAYEYIEKLKKCDICGKLCKNDYSRTVLLSQGRYLNVCLKCYWDYFGTKPDRIDV